MKRRPLWRCPKCGKYYVTRNMWHACARHTVDEHFVRRDPKLRLLFDGLVGLAKRNGPLKVAEPRHPDCGIAWAKEAEVYSARVFSLKNEKRRRTMRNLRSVGVLALFAAAILIFAAGTARAQDPVQVAPNHYKVLLENEHVRVLDFHAKAGDKVPMHSHPAYVAYWVSGSGKTKFTSPDGKTSESESAAGTAIWRDAETHAAEYLGPGEQHVILVELKSKAHHAATPKKKE